MSTRFRMPRHPAEAFDVLSHLKIELPTAQLGAASRTLAEMRLI